MSDALHWRASVTPTRIRQSGTSHVTRPRRLFRDRRSHRIGLGNRRTTRTRRKIRVVYLAIEPVRTSRTETYVPTTRERHLKAIITSNDNNNISKQMRLGTC